MRKPKEATQATQPGPKPKTVTVYAKHGHFVDLIKDVDIGTTPIEVEIHDWLQDKIDVGLLIKC